MFIINTMASSNADQQGNGSSNSLEFLQSKSKKQRTTMHATSSSIFSTPSSVPGNNFVVGAVSTHLSLFGQCSWLTNNNVKTMPESAQKGQVSAANSHIPFTVIKDNHSQDSQQKISKDFKLFGQTIHLTNNKSNNLFTSATWKTYHSEPDFFQESWMVEDGSEESQNSSSASTSRRVEPIFHDFLQVEATSDMSATDPSGGSKLKREKRKSADDPTPTGPTPPVLVNVPEEDPWKVKKVLTDSDVGNLSRLLVKQELIKNHVLGYLEPDSVCKVHSKNGAKFAVRDRDTGTDHELVLKQWDSNKSYILNGGWGKGFVKRRGLKRGDEIGLYWNPNESRFIFSVLGRAVAAS